MRHQPDNLPFPNWLRTLLAASAITQVIAAVVFVFGPPEGWSRIVGLPVPVAQALMGLGALLLVILAALAQRTPVPRPLVDAYAWLAHLRQHPASLILPGLLLIPFFLTIADHWLGLTLLSLQMWWWLLILFRAGEEIRAPLPDRWWIVGGSLLLAAGLGLRLWLLSTGSFPDEGSLLNAVTNMVETGHIASKGIRLPDTAPNRPEWGRLLIIYGWWGRLFGVGLIQTRVLGLLLGLGMLAVQFAIVRLWYGTRTAFLGTGLAALGWLGMQSVAGRNNALPMLAFGLVLWLHVDTVVHHRAAWRHALIGLLAALSLEAHLANLALLASLGGTYALDYLGGIFRERKPLIRGHALWLYLLGALPGLALYLYIHVLSLPDPMAYLNHMSAHAGTSPGLLAALLSRLTGIVPAYSELWLVSPLEVLVLLATILAAIIRWRKPDRHWLSLLLSYEVGYLLVRSQFIVNIGYSAMAAPLLYAGLGPLVVRGLGRDDGTLARWRIPLVAALAVGLAAFSVRGIGDSRAVRQELEAYALPAEEIVHRYVPPGQTIVGADFYYPYFTEYEYLFPTWWRPTKLSSALADMPKNAYWMDVYLETWPRAQVLSYHNAEDGDLDETEPLLNSYLDARHAFKPIESVWIVPDDGLIVDAPYAAPTDALLQMVGHRPLPDSLMPGEAFEVGTVWVTRDSITTDVSARLNAVAPDGTTLDLGGEMLVGGWNGLPTGEWGGNRFYDVALLGTVPADASPGAYTLHITLSPDGPDAPCQPGCAFDVGMLMVGN